MRLALYVVGAPPDCLVGVRVAQRKGRNPATGALMAFFFSLLGILVLYLVADQSEARKKELFGRN